jgi:hypothetical protein
VNRVKFSGRMMFCRDVCPYCHSLGVCNHRGERTSRLGGLCDKGVGWRQDETPTIASRAVRYDQYKLCRTLALLTVAIHL